MKITIRFLIIFQFLSGFFCRAAEKTTLIFFTDSIKCPACIRLKKQVLDTPVGKKELEKFTAVITADRSRPATMHHPFVKRIRAEFPGRIRLPHAVIVGADGKINGRISGFMPAGIYLKELQFYRELPPLFQTVIRGNENELQKIMTQKEYIKSTPLGTTAVILAIQRRRDDHFLRTLIRLSDKKTLQRQDIHLRNALHYAAETNRDTIIPLLLAAGVNSSQKDIKGDTPLSLAEKAGHKDVVKLLAAE